MEVLPWEMKLRLLSMLACLFPIANGRCDFNQIILDQIGAMPQAGGYATTSEAHRALSKAATIENGSVRLRPQMAIPSYCSGATYLVFLKAIGTLQKQGRLSLSTDSWQQLLPAPLPDGVGVWGRWNANGPGTARLFHEAGIGENFTEWERAKPGDFMKIFWVDAVGKHERGHSVIYLGTEVIDGKEHVSFWSSNKPGGYSSKTISKSKVAKVIFSRLTHPEKLAALNALPEKDIYLASLLSRESSFREACEKSGITR